MRTLLITDREPVPAKLRHILAEGSTELDEVSAHDLVTYVSQGALGVDRLVFWAGRGDLAVRTLALNYATAEDRDHQQTIFFIAAEPSAPIDGLTPDQMLVWPTDEDKLKLLFLTGG
jgi:hypothetical protein